MRPAILAGLAAIVVLGLAVAIVVSVDRSIDPADGAGAVATLSAVAGSDPTGDGGDPFGVETEDPVGGPD